MRNKGSSRQTHTPAPVPIVPPPPPLPVPSTKTIGIRLDPGYLYNDYPSGTTPASMAAQVVSTVKACGFNTIYAYAYSSTYGAYYTTTYANVAVEGTLGAGNFFGLLIAAATSAGLKVIAGFPINNFLSVWTAQSAWRAMAKSGKNYTQTDFNPLSASNTSFQSWFSGFLTDFLTRNPGVYGLEAIEGMIDLNWDGSVDYSQAATTAYLAAYPNGTLGDANWYLFRAAAITKLHALLAQAAHAASKQARVVQTWTANADGTLFTSAAIANGDGFDFSGIMNLTGTSKPDAMAGEFMWQQWAAQYGGSVFTPAWTTTAAQEFNTQVAGRTEPILHFELSPFSGNVGTVTPTNAQFQATVAAAIATGLSYDIYDFHQLKTTGLLSTLRVS